MQDLAGVVLAAGRGARLAPLTRVIPKAMCPVGNEPLVDHAIARLAGALGLDAASPGADAVAVNTHHGRHVLAPHVAGRTHVSVEEPEALGTAGAIGALRPWIDGRDVLVTNADAWLGPPTGPDLGAFVAGWDGERVRLLCVTDPARGDFGPLRYAGVCLLPARLVAGLDATPAGLYERCWRHEHAAGRLDTVVHEGPFVDCGTPADYLRANVGAVAVAGGSIVAGSAVVAPTATVTRSVVGPGAVVEGEVVESVLWAGSTVSPSERLRGAVRAGGVTVLVR